MGFFAKKVNVIPVERPQDLAFKGEGMITCLKDNVLYVNFGNYKDIYVIYRVNQLNSQKS